MADGFTPKATNTTLGIIKGDGGSTVSIASDGTLSVVTGGGGGVGSVTSVSGTAPITVTSPTTTPVIALTTPLAAQYGGTGFNGASAANGSLPIGNGSGFSNATLTAGANVTITNGTGSITIASTGGGSTSGQSGNVSITIAAGTSTNTGSVSFSPAFGTAPNVVLGCDTGTVVATAESITTSGFTARITCDVPLPSGTTITAKVYWAVGSGNAGTVTNVTASAPITSSGGATPNIALTTPLACNYGGTGLDTSSAANGDLLIGTGSGLALATLTAGAGINVTNGSGTITVAATAGTPFTWSTQTANYTILLTDTGILADASSGNITITCPTAVGLAQLFTIKKKDSSANTVTVAAHTGEHIDGASTFVISLQNQSITVGSDNANLYIV